MSQKKTSVTLSDDGLKLLALLALRNGISRTAMLEVLIRKDAKSEGIVIKQAEDLKEGS